MSALESPVLKWLCFTWCGAATILLLSVPKLIVDSSASLDSQVGRLCSECRDRIAVFRFDGLSPLWLLLQVPTDSESMTMTGYVLGYLASVFYLTSRFPQLYKNVSDNVFVC